MKNLFVYFLVCFNFLSCSNSEKEFTFKNEDGSLALTAIGRDINNACYTEYHDNGAIKRQVCLKDSLKNGLDQSFYESGNIYRSAKYNRDILVGFDSFFHENGSIDYMTEGVHDSYIGDKIYKYDETGKLSEIKFIKFDIIYYTKKYTYINNTLSDSIEIFNPIIQTNKDTFNIGDTSTIHFYLPQGLKNVDYNSLVINYEIIKSDENNDSQVYIKHSLPLGGEGIFEKFHCMITGKLTIIGRLSQKELKGKNKQLGMFLKEIVIK